MKKQAIFKTSLGISIGDRVRTSYGSGGIVTSILPPRFVSKFVGPLIVRSWPVMDITYDKQSFINSVRREGGRWFTDQNDEVIVERGAGLPSAGMQMDLFGSEYPIPAPYPFNPNVDYDGLAWRCEKCDLDFNAPLETRYGRWHCIQCGKYGVMRVLLMHPRDQVVKPLNSYLLSLGEIEELKCHA